jgi:hypothetical protein
MIDGFATLESFMVQPSKKPSASRMTALAERMKREASIRKSEFDLALLK